MKLSVVYYYLTLTIADHQAIYNVFTLNTASLPDDLQRAKVIIDEFVKDIHEFDRSRWSRDAALLIKRNFDANVELSEVAIHLHYTKNGNEQKLRDYYWLLCKRVSEIEDQALRADTMVM